MTFDQVLPALLRTCEETDGFANVTKAVVVRDLRGRVRLAFSTAAGAAAVPDVAALETHLKAALSQWFEPPILGPGVGAEASRLRGTVLGLDSIWADPSWLDQTDGTKKDPPPGKWHLVERHLSKLEWLGTAKTAPPWGLTPAMPAIVTFYSFKGGVGRTTLLASTAWQLAREGKRVVAVDLDVEAPGIGSLLGAKTERGVLDFLVDHAAVGSNSLDSLTAPASDLGADAPTVDVLPAGSLNRDYFEKLARLDFSGSGLFGPEGARPVRDALRALLFALAKRDPRPDYILLDSRAGLHDLAGLSLHDLAHVDVIVGRDSDQGYQGLELTVEALGRRRAFRENRCVVVQSMAPDDPRSQPYLDITGAYKKRSYEAFVEHVYARAADEDDDPELDDDQAGHFPHVIRFDQRLVHFTSIAVREAEVLGEDYQRVKRRIVALCAPEAVA